MRRVVKSVCAGVVASAVVGAAGLACGAASGQVDSSFTYQGRLQDGGVNYSGSVSITVSVFANAAGGAALCQQVFGGVAVENGLFSVEVDACDGEDLGSENRWLEVSIDTGAGAMTLSPRQRLTASPYAVQPRGMVVDEFGNVAVGTEEPDDEFHVQGDSVLRVGNALGRSAAMSSNGVPGWTLREGGVLAAAGFGFGTLSIFGSQINTYETSSGTNLVTTASGLDGGSLGGFFGVYSPYVATNVPMVSMFSDADVDLMDGVGTGQLRVRSMGGGPGGEVQVLNDDATGGVFMLGGAAGEGGEITIKGSSGDVEAVLGSLSFGSQLELLDEENTVMAVLEPDIDGTGLFARFAPGSGDGQGMIWNGNTLDGGSLTVRGVGDMIGFTPDAPTADFKVTLPVSSVSSTEIGNETGVAETIDTGVADIISVTGTQSVGSVTIDCPTSGYVVVIGTLQYGFAHQAGTTSLYNVGVSTSPTSLPSNQDFAIQKSAADPTGGLAGVATVHGVFAVPVGSSTFYLNANKSVVSPDLLVNDEQLSAIFVPTAYGSAAASAEGFDVPDAQRPVRGSLTAGEIASERESALMANIMRQQRELAEQRAAFEAMRADLALVMAEQAAMRDERAAGRVRYEDRQPTVMTPGE